MKHLRSNAKRAKRCIAFLFVWSIVFPSFAQTKARNALLTDIMNQLSSYNVANDFAGERYVDDLCKDKTIIVHRDRTATIDHIGFKLFEREIMEKHPSPIYHFAERYLLQLLLLDNDQAIREKLKRERVRITSEIIPMTSYKKGIKDILAAFTPGQSIYITCNNNRYTLTYAKDQKSLFSFNFPVRYELITGNTKLEAENSFYPELTMHSQSQPASISAADLSMHKDSLYCTSEDYYGMENIVSTAYFRKEGDRFAPILSLSKPVESVYNLFNARHDWKVEAEITQKLYGNKSNSFTVPLTQLTDYLRTQKCSLYTGIRKMENDRIEGVVIAANMELGYQHFMTFTLDKSLLENPKKGNVKIKMYCYIPIHNIASLFGENKTK